MVRFASTIVGLAVCLAGTGCTNPRDSLSGSPSGVTFVDEPGMIRTPSPTPTPPENPWGGLPLSSFGKGPVDRLAVVMGERANVLREPKAYAPIIGSCDMGRYVVVVEARPPFAGVRMTDGKLGWIHGRRLLVLDTPAHQSDSPIGLPANRVVARAMTYLGVPYVWGGTSATGLDCSGFVQRVFAEAGYSLPRVAVEQWQVGVYVSRAALQPGDRVYFQSGNEIDHTGIYIGDEKFIHATKSRGEVVVSRLDDSPWDELYVGAKR